MSGAEPDLVRWLADPGAVQRSCGGGKGANLARLSQAALPVPAGFIVGTAAYQRFVEVAGLASLIARVTGELDGADPAAVEAASATLRAAFEASPIPPDLAAATRTAYLALGGGSVAVRSPQPRRTCPRRASRASRTPFSTSKGRARSSPRFVATGRRCGRRGRWRTGPATA